MAKNTMD